MKEVIFDADGLVVSQAGTKFYVQYDAGAHQIVIRGGEISEGDARGIISSPAEANKVLFELQKRLAEAGVDPYVSSVKQ